MNDQKGFTLIEITIAILLLTGAVLGIAASAGRMIAPAGQAEEEFTALLAVEDQISKIQLDPRYLKLDSIYTGTETNLPGLTNMTRSTVVTRVQNSLGGGKVLDYTKVQVTVSGGHLPEAVSRMVVVAKP